MYKCARPYSLEAWTIGRDGKNLEIVASLVSWCSANRWRFRHPSYRAVSPLTCQNRSRSSNGNHSIWPTFYLGFGRGYKRVSHCLIKFPWISQHNLRIIEHSAHILYAAEQRSFANIITDMASMSKWLKRAALAVKGRIQHKKIVKYDKRRYKRCNRIESIFRRLKGWRRVATRYGRCPKVFLSPQPSYTGIKYWAEAGVCHQHVRSTWHRKEVIKLSLCRHIHNILKQDEYKSTSTLIYCISKTIDWLIGFPILWKTVNQSGFSCVGYWKVVPWSKANSVLLISSK